MVVAGTGCDAGKIVKPKCRQKPLILNAPRVDRAPAFEPYGNLRSQVPKPGTSKGVRHEATGVHYPFRRRGGILAARGARAAAGFAGNWNPGELRCEWLDRKWRPSRRLPAGAEGAWLRRGRECCT